jgi:hypothetical protein
MGAGVKIATIETQSQERIAETQAATDLQVSQDMLQKAQIEASAKVTGDELNAQVNFDDIKANTEIAKLENTQAMEKLRVEAERINTIETQEVAAMNTEADSLVLREEARLERYRLAYGKQDTNNSHFYYG